MKECGAKTRAGGTCKKPGSGAGGRCRFHGGASLGGIASKTFKNGRYSKYMPGRLLEQYQTAASDSELVALRDDIALIDVRTGELLGKIDTGESGLHWKKVKATFDEFRSANAKEDVESAKKALSELARLITDGAKESQVWGEIANLLERRRRLVESERRRLIDMQQMISAPRVYVMIAAVSDIIRRHVTDSAALNAIAVEIRGLVTAPTSGLADAARDGRTIDGSITGEPAAS